MSREPTATEAAAQTVLFGPAGIEGIGDAAVRREARRLLTSIRQASHGPARCLCPESLFFGLGEGLTPTGKAPGPKRAVTLARLLSLLLKPDEAAVRDRQERSERHGAWFTGWEGVQLADLRVARLAREVEHFARDPAHAPVLGHRLAPNTLFGLQLYLTTGRGFGWWSELRFCEFSADWVIALWWDDWENSAYAALPLVGSWAHRGDLYRSILLLLAENEYLGTVVGSEALWYGPELPPEPYHRAIELTCIRPDEGGLDLSRARWLALPPPEALASRVEATLAWRPEEEPPWSPDLADAERATGNGAGDSKPDPGPAHQGALAFPGGLIRLSPSLAHQVGQNAVIDPRAA